jgi:penicillin amidase
LWTANARTIDAKRWLEFLGNSDYVLGARAAQIRDDLLALDQATIEDMRKIQLDDRALFLERWRSLLQALLTKQAVGTNAERGEALRLITHWSQHAAINDAGYRIVRAFRARVRDDVFDTLVGAVIEKYPDLDFTVPTQFEGPLWQIITERPEHLLPPQFPNWDAALLDSLDRALETLVEECGDLGSCTWGQRNTLTMQHPLSSAIPWLGRWIDMPPQPLPGDEGMPRVQGPAFGASQRMVVSPGREAEGILQLPGGPVDHPLSPFYGAGHEAWAKGEAQPLLPGAVEYALRLEPQRAGRGL